MSYLQALSEQFKTLLVEAAKDRDKREQFLPRADGTGTEPAWVIHERKLMHEAVNQERAKRSKKPINMTDVKRVEQLALGHVDYAHKYALYCAELVLCREEISEPLGSLV